MKKLLLILTLGFMFALAACGTYSGGEELKVGIDEKFTFQATILEIHDKYYLVEPVDGSAELNGADQIMVPMNNMNPSPEPEIGDILEIESNGVILDSYPAQIAYVYSISVVK